MLSRREWMMTAAQAAIGSTLFRTNASAGTQAARSAPGSPIFCLFSKHLPELGWADVARAVKDAGFEGVDLTVRAKGHVLPERAADDLPRAIDAITSQGVKVPMITTDLTSATAPVARPLLMAAARNGVRFFKTGYWRYNASSDVRAQVAAAGEALAGLAALARECGIEMGFHNHAAYIGAALWDIAPAMDHLNPRWAGYYFDPRHAVAEGGAGAWKSATRLVVPRLKMLALKDCYWSKTPKGWIVENCPLGEGMVDWSWVSQTIRSSGFSGPISVHLEYEIPAGTAHTLDAARRDLAIAKKILAV